MSHQNILGILEATSGFMYNSYLDINQFYISEQTIVVSWRRLYVAYFLEATESCI